ncbi:Altered inheritance of mitochondria protein 24, mitochondrial [Vermiconidia calcicola]|uniref:Altered inheritance of mitochondria protein 24, mitochondrial n=1 Tax=Vermiconidia calcicola TaxID=1690605 RepID=A0ACC3NWT8_9PEZI|nr:Altered inheritance of mitochondria protein 24, mitochondrial [Vermiconidia calcicola]
MATGYEILANDERKHILEVPYNSGVYYTDLFLHFHGPATILVQSRGAALSDALTTRDVSEIADSPAGAVPKALAKQSSAEAGISTQSSGAPAAAPALSYASVTREGTVKFNEEKQ